MANIDRVLKFAAFCEEIFSRIDTDIGPSLEHALSHELTHVVQLKKG